MIEIDGTYGEGGGQILRTSLALSLVTGKPFRIENIRGKRQKPGLLRQHFTAVTAATEIGCAEAEGAFVGSQSLSFSPTAVRGGTHAFAVGTAGSATLVLQTILPALAVADSASTLVLEGGTHNPWAPPFDFVRDTFMPCLKRMGAQVDLVLHRPGFYPAGGGKFEVSIAPGKTLEKLHLEERGDVKRVSVHAQVAHIPESIALREARVIAREFDLDDDCINVETVQDSIGPGNVVSVKVESENVTEVMTGFGERGVSAKKVAKRVANEAKHYIEAGAAVGRHLADQLLIPMSIGRGGSFTTVKPTLHTETNIDVIEKFLDVSISTEQLNDSLWRIKVSPTKGPNDET